MIRTLPLLLVLAAVAFGCVVPGSARAQAAPAPAITQSQAQQTLDVLKDDKKRAALIGTLETIAKATPEAAAPKPALPIPLEPGSAGAQILAGLSRFFDHLSAQSRAAFDAMGRAPELWGGFAAIADDPAQREQLLDALWRLAAAAGCGLVIEWLLLLALRRPQRRLLGAAPPATNGTLESDSENGALARAEQGETESFPRRRIRATAWTLLRRLPLALARLALDLIPVLGFVMASHLVIASRLGGTELVRLVLLALVNAYAICRALLCVARAVFSPTRARLRLVLLSNPAAQYVMRWLRRLIGVAVFGIALADAGLLPGLSQEAHDAVLKAVGLVLHVMLIVIVLEKRAAVARRLRAPPGAKGFIAAVRNGFAVTWHWIALFYLVAAWLVWAVELPNGFTRLLHFAVTTAVVLLVGRLVLIVVLGTLDRLTRPRPELASDPLIGTRLRLYLPILRRVLTVLVYGLVLLELLQVWGLGTVSWLTDSISGRRVLSACGSVALTILLAFIAWEAASIAIERHLARLAGEQQAARSARLRTLLPLLRTALLITLLVIVALMVLSDLGINIAPLLAGAGVVGIAIGFGSQKLVQDVITGLFLLLENAVQVGDVVTVAGLGGSVEHLSIRSIRLRAEDGSVHVIPFSSVTTVTNMTRDFGYAVIEASVSYNDEYDDVVTVLRDIVKEMREEPRWASEIRDDLEVMGLEKFADSSILIKARIRCGPFGRWSIRREFNRRMKLRFDEHGIEIPYPHQQLVMAPSAAPAGGTLATAAKEPAK
ncbi:MAG: mechanosensitive ion channel [Alphaproteobacteria bacterium]|nr:mechanosensitive ion channel [Alphaproteobacteria bacterium]